MTWTHHQTTTLAKYGVIRTVRRSLTRRRLVLIAIGQVSATALLVGFYGRHGGLVALGETLTAPSERPPQSLTDGVASLFVLTVILGCFRAAMANESLSAYERTSLVGTPVHRVALSRLLRDACVVTALTGPVLLGAGAALAVGAGTVWSLPVIVGGSYWVTLAGYCTGYPIGAFVRSLLDRMPGGSALAANVAFGLVTSGLVNNVSTVGAVLRETPLSVLTFVPFVTTPGPEATGAVPVVVVVCATIAGWLILPRVLGLPLERVWIDDGTTDSERTPPDHQHQQSRLPLVSPTRFWAVSRLERGVQQCFLPVVGSRAIRTLAVVMWRRALANPASLWFGITGFGGALLLWAALVTGTLGPATDAAPVVVAMLLTAGFCSAIALNPLSHHRPAAPVVFSARLHPGSIVHGCAGSAGWPAVPVAMLGAGGTAVGVGYSMPMSVAVSLFAGVLAAAAPYVAVLIGVRFPRYKDADRLSLPSRLAGPLFSLSILVVTAPALLVVTERIVSLSLWWKLVGVGVAGTLAVAGAWVAYRRTARLFAGTGIACVESGSGLSTREGFSGTRR